MIVLPRGPLDDDDYEPEHPPIGGRVPAAVERFGPRTQVRWFTRFRDALADRWPDAFYVSSVDHRGRCCQRCETPPSYRHGEPIISGPCCHKAAATPCPGEE